MQLKRSLDSYLQYKFVWIFIALLTLSALPIHGQSNNTGQEPANNDWIRIGDEAGLFSIEIPSAYRAIYSSSNGRDVLSDADFVYSEFYFVSSSVNGTFFGVDVYKARSRQVSILHRGARKSGQRNAGNIENNGRRILRSSQITKDHTIFQQFIPLNDHILILTAASRKGETPEMKRFFDSVRLSKGSDRVAETATLMMSKLVFTEVIFRVESEEERKIQEQKRKEPAKALDPGYKPTFVFSKPTPSFTLAAQNSGTRGKVVLRVVFGKDGFVQEIVVRNALPDGLLRQALMTAVRIRCIPGELEGIAQNTSRTVEYIFSSR